MRCSPFVGGLEPRVRNFIDYIPDSKLSGFPNLPTTLYKDVDLRLDMQGITSNDEWNIQIQVNFGCKTTSLRPFAPTTVAGPALVSRTASLSLEEIRAILRATMCC
ncbi:hypothetical protein C8A05DRAFT_20078 [Staphylotrichum tortipilum]|uniref:Uncharacterized protein n=1 Tax=Staphylotrichum tortipilum TaxID=2831512 RepID=A0AAN6MAB6_9PEZI|nr:hypothetical protein C8A05DRAFT_20078 [Staphylotrichum longicolle]